MNALRSLTRFLPWLICVLVALFYLLEFKLVLPALDVSSFQALGLSLYEAASSWLLFAGALSLSLARLL